MKQKVSIKESEYNIMPAIIRSVRSLTDKEKLYEIAFKNGDSLNHDPGQFIEVSLLGVGEAPISIASSPTKRDAFDICVRSVGKVTAALNQLGEGAEIGIRGPFGKGFPIRNLEGNDILIVGGGLGIVPLRGLINYVIDNRREFGKIHILIGCRDPQSLLFNDEIAIWDNRLDLHLNCTVDKGSEEWKGSVGVITHLIPGVDLNPKKTRAIVVGPPIMYKFVIKALIDKDIPEDQIFLSLERHMKCGLGKCGHCQINNYYCCQDGPVFCYSTIKHLEEAF